MKKWITYAILCILIPAVILGGIFLFDGKQYAWVSLCIVLLACIPLFLRFERRETDVKRLVLIAVMVALSVAGRILFTPIPGFKPVTALVVITAMYFGGEAGFLTGALSAVISNFYFGQGPWTPFQMFSWGMVGLIAGMFAGALKRNRLILLLYAALSGVLYSFLMDIWSVLWMDGAFHLSRYLATLLTSAKFTAIYAVSNVVFLFVFAKPMGKILQRVKTKYGI